ncbi:hypothetical protein C1646_672824 [Rhizophagus diaphanus]|nr:hypothetical protein C1646_672824 [Rhizophagus diaphanus] [Rhizophagus sp. MUCL 43196]
MVIVDVYAKHIIGKELWEKHMKWSYKPEALLSEDIKDNFIEGKEVEEQEEEFNQSDEEEDLDQDNEELPKENNEIIIDKYFDINEKLQKALGVEELNFKFSNFKFQI